MTSAIDDLNAFLDASDREPTSPGDRDAAKIMSVLGAAPEPDPTFLHQLERRLAEVSQPRMQLVLPSKVASMSEWIPATRRRRTPGMAVAALLVAILVGGLLGGLIATREKDRPVGVLAPAAFASPPLIDGDLVLSATADTSLYSAPGDQNTVLMNVAAGVVFKAIGSQIVNGAPWTHAQIRGTTISGWTRSLGLAMVSDPSQSASEATKSGPAVSSTSVTVLNSDGTTGASAFDIGAVTWVTASADVWTQPGPDMSIQRQELPQDQLMVTGPPVSFNGEMWLPIENWAMGTGGWVAASTLAPVDAAAEVLGEPNSTRKVVTSLLGAALFPKPYVFSKSITTLEPGTTLIITDASNQGGMIWLKLEIPGTTVAGWCKAELASPASPQVRLDAINLVDRSRAFTPLAPNASVTVAQQVRVWSRPGTTMSVVSTAKVTDQLTITDYPLESDGRVWVAVAGNTTGEMGWVLSAYINPVITAIPAGWFDATPDFVTTLGGASLFEKPNEASAALISLYPGKELPVKGSISLNGVRWVQVQVPGTTMIGWSRISEAKPRDNSASPESGSAPITFSGNADLLPGEVVRTNGTVRVWSKPGPDMSKIWTAGPDDKLSVLGAPTDHVGASWVQIKDETSGQTGWIVTSFLFPIDAGTPNALSTPAAGSRQAASPTVVVAQSENIPGMGSSQLNNGELVHVAQPANVWSLPGTKMNVVGRANTFERYVVTGVLVEYNGVAWAPIGNPDSGEQSGWVLAEYLVQTNSLTPMATPLYDPPHVTTLAEDAEPASP